VARVIGIGTALHLRRGHPGCRILVPRRGRCRHRRRVYDAVVLKVLGATRGTIAAASSFEHGLLGLVTAIVAVIGTLAAYALVTGPMRSEWLFLPTPLAVILGLAVMLTVVIGFAGTWHALGAKPAAYLRNE
jgi:putative ABC transport system permease protein